MDDMEAAQTRIDSVKTTIMHVHAKKYLHVANDASVSMI